MSKVNKMPICILLTVCMLLSMFSVPVIAADSSSAIFIEAEDGKLNSSGLFSKVKDKEASGGSYIVAAVTGVAKLEDPDSKDPHVTWEFDVPTDGTYYIWMRYACKGDSSDNYFIGFNDEKINSQYGNSVEATGEFWNWQRVYSSAQPLKAGKNTIKLYPREYNLKVDAFYVTADQDFVPDELAKMQEEAEKREEEAAANRVVEPIGPVNKFDGHGTMFEAESSASEGLITINDENASERKAIEMPKLPSNFDREKPELYGTPAVTYTVEIPKNGTYYVWARMYAPTKSSDTSWICWDIEDYTKIDYTVHEEYSWQKVLSTTLTAGTHTLNLVPREAGMVFDKFIVSSNVAYMPTGMGDIDGEITYATVYPTPSFLPPAGHPRVYFTAEDVPTIRENLTKPQNAATYEMYRGYVEDTSTDGKLQQKDGSNFSAKTLAIIESKAFEYAINGDEARGKEAVSMMKNVCDTANIEKYDYNQAGQTIFTIAAVYDWCYPLLDDETKAFFSNMTTATATYLEVGWPPTKQGAVTGHGVEGQIMRDLMCAGLAMYDERPDIYINTAGRFFSEFIEPKEFMYPAQMHNQGDHYAAYRYQWEILCTWILDRVGYPRVFGDEQQYLMYQYLYTRRPDGQVFKDGDGSKNNIATGTYYNGYARSMFLAANYFGDPYLKWEAMRELPNFCAQTPSGNQTLNPVEFLVFNDPDLEAKPVSELPLTHYNPSPKGGMVARTGWEDGFDSPAVVAEMKINEYWFANHQHLDAGSFQIYYKGALANDTGYYQAYRTSTSDTANNGNTDYGSAHFNNYYRRTIAHNSMLVYDPNEPLSNFGGHANDGGQRMPNNGSETKTLDDLLDPAKGYKVGEILGHEYGTDPIEPNYSYLKGDISDAYSDKVDNFERSFMFLNLKDEAHPAAILVFDRVISSNKDFEKIWLCHGLNEPQISGSRTVFTDTRESKDDSYNGKLTIDTLLPAADNVDISAVGGEGKEHWVFGTNYEGKPVSGGSNEGGGWRVEISPKTANEEDYFLNVLQVGDADGAEALPVTLIETDKVAGAVVSDRVVVFGKDRDRTADEVSFSFSGDGEYELTVADLQAGTWTVKKDGADLCEAIVTEDGGVAVFNGGAGTYTLTYKDSNATREPVGAETPTDEGISIRVDGRFIYSDVAPITVNDRTLVPMRAIFEKLGVEVSYDGATATATAVKDGREVKITENSTTAYIDGQPYELDAPAMVLNDRFVVPVRFVSETFKASVDWQEFGKIVDVKTTAESGPSGPGQDQEGYITIQGCEFSDYFEDEVGFYSYDGDLETWWSCEGVGSWITYDLGTSQEVKGMDVIWNKAGQRQAYFEVEVSDDNKTWKKVITDGKGSGEADLAWEHYDFPAGTKGRYVRVVTNGNSTSEWNAIIEIKFKE